jgi:polar amino acid transport system substrate-binding protein
MQVATDATYPPFESIDPASGSIVGFDADLIQAVAEHLGVRAELRVVPFDGILAGLRSGKYDAVISCLTITEDRARKVLFSDPYYSAGQSVCVRHDSPIRGPADLEGRRIGVQLGTTGERAAHRVAGAEVVSFDQISAALIDLRNGHLDAVIVDTPTGLLFSREHPEIRPVGEPITKESYGIAFRLEDERLKRAVDTALRRIEEEGDIEALRETWGLRTP